MMFHDHHFHPMGYAQMKTGLELMDSANLDQVKARVSARAEQTSGAIIGQRLNDEGLAELRLPTRTDLDKAVPDRPVVLYRYCGHIAVANSEALRLAGIDASTPDPPGGAFDRDRTGFPTGVLRETALLVIGNAIAPLAEAPSDADVLEALRGLVDYGLGSVTGMVSATDPIWCGVGDELEALCRMAPDLPLDIDVYVITESPADLFPPRNASQRPTVDSASPVGRALPMGVSAGTPPRCTSPSPTSRTPPGPFVSTGARR